MKMQFSFHHVGPVRWLCPATVLAFAAFISAHAAAPAKGRVYIGTYTAHGSQGIYVCEFDPSNGTLTPPELAAATADPSFVTVAPDRRFLYAINETDHFNGQPTGGVSAFSISPASGKLTLLNQVSSLAPGPAYITLDRSGRYVLVANYDEGSVAVYRIFPDGKIGDSTAFVRHYGSSVNPDRQKGPHAHSIAMSPDNRFAIVADLGLDELLVYPFDASQGTLGTPRVVKTDAGVGPRHLTLASSGKFVYVINELQSSLTVYSYGAGDGSMVPLQKISTLPSSFHGENTAAEVVLDPAGKFLYASNRGDDNSVAVFAVDPKKGTLTPIEFVPTQGKTPRNFAIDPSGRWLLAANQDSNNIVTFRINAKSGRLTSAGKSIEVNSPTIVDFVPLAGEK
ncbi:MAG: lactonase family protein [Candidatus Acidiferrales bacterium]